MSKFKVDNEQINAAVETLKKLLKECEDAYNVEIPASDVDKGETHDELIIVCDNIRHTCYCYGQLIHNTIGFLGKSSEMFEQSDRNSANAIKDGTDSGGSGGNSAGSAGVVTVNQQSDIPNTQWKEITPHKTNVPGQRSPDAYREVLADLDVENRARYTPGNATWCNIYVWDATKAMGCEIPHFYDPNTGKETDSRVPGTYLEMSASRMTNWLEQHGQANGWIECDAATAIAMANKGLPTVVAATTTGHVGMVVPQNAGDTGVMISQAGASNFNYGPQQNGFGKYPTKYFYHI